MRYIPPCNNPKVPAPAVPFHHCLDLQQRFNDIDMFGHVNNAVYMQMFDLGKVHYFNAVMGGEIDWHKATVVVVNINATFFSPAYFGEPLAVLTAVSRISTHSFILEQRIVNPDNGDVKCTARTVMAGFDPSTATGIEIPANWVEALNKFESVAE